jgi:hypothetical protein
VLGRAAERRGLTGRLGEEQVGGWAADAEQKAGAPAPPTAALSP